MRLHYQEQLRDLEQLAVRSMGVVVSQIDKVVEALEFQDIELASLVIEGERPLATIVRDLHAGVLSILARQSPVAGDLRLIAALMHSIKHIERMGRQCTTIAKLIPLTGHEPPRQEIVLATILKMGSFARDEVVQARQSLELRDTAMAMDILRRDQSLNELNREVFKFAIEHGDEIDSREWLMTMTMVARALERIGDNAVDIGEQVIFAVDGDYPSRRVQLG